MAAKMLVKLAENIDKKVEVHLKNGEKLRCKPQQYLEEDYESFLVETYENYGSYSAGMLVELEEDQISAVKKM